ncbi:unnamed protein product [Cochlearia groenlandica]
MIKSINAFLSSKNFSISLRSNSVPSVKDISEILIFLLSAVDYPCDPLKWDEEVIFFIRSMKCPYKLDSDFLSKFEAERADFSETISALEKAYIELECKAESLKKGPSMKESRERVKAILEQDVYKMHTLVVELVDKTRGIEKLVEKKAMEAKSMEA